jgi:hypothetical protein
VQVRIKTNYTLQQNHKHCYQKSNQQNLINWIHELCEICSAFEGLEKLETLDISENDLVKIDMSLFKPLNNLKDLNASKNKFEAKIIEVKSGIPSLES